MPKFNAENMIAALSGFYKKYKYPVYVKVSVQGGFFSSETVMRYGYAAISDDHFLLVADYETEDSENVLYHRLPVTGMRSLSVKKADKVNMFAVRIKGITAESKKYRIKIFVTASEGGSSLPEQKENSVGFIEKLSKWSKEI